MTTGHTIVTRYPSGRVTYGYAEHNIGSHYTRGRAPIYKGPRNVWTYYDDYSSGGFATRAREAKHKRLKKAEEMKWAHRKKVYELYLFTHPNAPDNLQTYGYAMRWANAKSLLYANQKKKEEAVAAAAAARAAAAAVRAKARADRIKRAEAAKRRFKQSRSTMAPMFAYKKKNQAGGYFRHSCPECGQDYDNCNCKFEAGKFRPRAKGKFIPNLY